MEKERKGLVLVHSPLPNVKHSGAFEEQDLQPVLDAVAADVLQGPVPVVVVEVAEEVPAPVDLSPKVPVEGHAHVVLGTDPLGQLKLE